MGTRHELNKAALQFGGGLAVAAVIASIMTFFPLPYRMYLFAVITAIGYGLTWSWLGSLVKDAIALVASGRNGILAIQLITNLRITLVRLLVWSAVIVSIAIEHIQGDTKTLDSPRVFLFSLLVVIMFASTIIDRRDRDRILEKLENLSKEL